MGRAAQPAAVGSVTELLLCPSSLWPDGAVSSVGRPPPAVRSSRLTCSIMAVSMIPAIGRPDGGRVGSRLSSCWAKTCWFLEALRSVAADRVLCVTDSEAVASQRAGNQPGSVGFDGDPRVAPVVGGRYGGVPLGYLPLPNRAGRPDGGTGAVSLRGMVGPVRPEQDRVRAAKTGSPVGVMTS